MATYSVIYKGVEFPVLENGAYVSNKLRFSWRAVDDAAPTVPLVAGDTFRSVSKTDDVSNTVTAVLTAAIDDATAALNAWLVVNDPLGLKANIDESNSLVPVP